MKHFRIGSMMTFLSQENAQYISRTFIKFMYDKYRFSYTSVVSDVAYYKLLGENMTTVYSQHNSDKSIGSMNMITISLLKKYFLDNHINNVPKEVVTDVPDQNMSVIDEEEHEDSDFLNKIQRLELNRKTFKLSASDTKVASAITSPLTDMNSPIYNTASPQISNAISTVFMPSPIKIGKEIKIHSHGREWMVPTGYARNGFLWRGPIPKMIDRSNTRIGCLICPTHVLEDTNILSLVIEGANKDEVSISLIPSHSVGDHTIFRPILESLSYVKLLALPWTISIESADAQKIALDHDGTAYQIVQVANNTTTIQLEKGTTALFKAGNSLRIYYAQSKTVVVSKVARVSASHKLDVTGSLTEDGQVLNYSDQISIILEMTITEHKSD